MTGLEGIGQLHNVFVGLIIISTIVEIASIAIYHNVIEKEKIKDKACHKVLSFLIIAYNCFYIPIFIMAVKSFLSDC
jgi:hypothetical protein